MAGITAFEAAFLADYIYKKSPRSIKIPSGKTWICVAYSGHPSEHYYAGCFESDNECVIIFRGSILNADNLVKDVQHLFGRKSAYVKRAVKFVNRFKSKAPILIGHSLGGFLALTVGDTISSRIIAFNPPWLLGLPGQVDIVKTLFSQTFARCQVVIYESTNDLVTGSTRTFKRRFPNIIYRSVGKIKTISGHNIHPFLSKLKGKGEIKWATP